MSKARDTLMLLGKQGAGKTTLLREQILPAISGSGCPPCFIVDTMGEFSTGEQFEDIGALILHVYRQQPAEEGRYVLNCQQKGDAEDLFKFLCDVGRAASRGGAPANLVVDEVSKFCTPHAIMQPLNDLIQYGRHWHHGLIFSARRAAEVHRSITAQSDAIVSFQQTESRDIAALRRSYDAADMLPRLDRYDYLCLGAWESLSFSGALRTERRRGTESRDMEVAA